MVHCKSLFRLSPGGVQDGPTFSVKHITLFNTKINLTEILKASFSIYANIKSQHKQRWIYCYVKNLTKSLRRGKCFYVANEAWNLNDRKFPINRKIAKIRRIATTYDHSFVNNVVRPVIGHYDRRSSALYIFPRAGIGIGFELAMVALYAECVAWMSTTGIFSDTSRHS